MNLRYKCTEYLETVVNVPRELIIYGPGSKDQISHVKKKKCVLQQEINGKWVDIPEVIINE